jgi:hypothetical protein
VSVWSAGVLAVSDGDRAFNGKLGLGNDTNDGKDDDRGGRAKNSVLSALGRHSAGSVARRDPARLTSLHGFPKERTRMDLKGLFNKGKKMVDDRGGVDSLKEDAQELAKIAKGKGSLTDKAKEAAAAVKEPGTNAPAGQGAAHKGHPTQPAGEERHPNRQATNERRADADRQESKERRHP